MDQSPLYVSGHTHTHTHQASGQPHGNTRQPESGTAYTYGLRTPAATLDAISNLTKQMPPNAAYSQLVTSKDGRVEPANASAGSRYALVTSMDVGAYIMHRVTATSCVAKRNVMQRLFDEKMDSTPAATSLTNGWLWLYIT